VINVGVDVGGTFTDFVVFDDQTRELTIRKVPSTPANPAEAILTGLREYFSESARPDEIGSFLHGTTITTNALIQRRGARCGLTDRAR
jgi:N-methylhydantoinase A